MHIEHVSSPPRPGAKTRRLSYWPDLHAHAGLAILALLVLAFMAAVVEEWTLALGIVCLALMAHSVRNHGRYLRATRLGLEKQRQMAQALAEEKRQRQAATGELRDSELRLQATFEQTAVGLAHAACDGTWLQANTHLCELLGYTSDELRHLRFPDMPHPLEPRSGQTELRRLLSGQAEEIDIERRYQRKDGSDLWVRLTATRVAPSLGLAAFVVIVVQDLSAAKRRQTELDARERLLQEGQRLAGMGNWTWQVHSDTMQWSPDLYDLLGQDPTAPPPAFPALHSRFAPDSLRRLSTMIQACKSFGTPWECDAQILRTDGSQRWVVVRGEAVHDGQDNVVRLQGTVQDITPRKRAELAMTQKLISLQSGPAPLEGETSHER